MDGAMGRLGFGGHVSGLVGLVRCGGRELVAAGHPRGAGWVRGTEITSPRRHLQAPTQHAQHALAQRAQCALTQDAQHAQHAQRAQPCDQLTSPKHRYWNAFSSSSFSAPSWSRSHIRKIRSSALTQGVVRRPVTGGVGGWVGGGGGDGEWVTPRPLLKARERLAAGFLCHIDASLTLSPPPFY